MRSIELPLLPSATLQASFITLAALLPPPPPLFPSSLSAVGATTSNSDQFRGGHHNRFVDGTHRAVHSFIFHCLSLNHKGACEHFVIRASVNCGRLPFLCCCYVARLFECLSRDYVSSVLSFKGIRAHHCFFGAGEEYFERLCLVGDFYFLL